MPPAPASRVHHKPKSRFSARALAPLVTVLLCVSAGAPVCAEERASWKDLAAYSPSFAYATERARPARLARQPVSSRAVWAPRSSVLFRIDRRTLRDLLSWPGLDARPAGGLMTLLTHKRTTSRFSSPVWTWLESGFGDVFDDDRVGRARMNGAGLEDPQHAYVKLCLGF